MLEGIILSIDNHRMARVNILGAVCLVSTDCVPDARPNDWVLIARGVAVAVLEKTEQQENNYVSRNPRKGP